MTNILNNPELKQQFIDKINYNIAEIHINNVKINKGYIFYNETSDLIEIHSKETNHFKQFDKFWYLSNIASISLKNYEAQKVNYDYNENGLFCIKLGFFPSIDFYIQTTKESLDIIKPLFKDYYKSTKLK